MWGLVPRKLQLLCVVIPTISFVWAAEAAIELVGSGPTNALKFASLVVFLIGTVAAGVAERFWRPIWRRYPVIGLRTFPDLNGVWHGQMLSTWVDRETGETPSAIPATFTIKQSLFAMAIGMRTGESRSRSTRCHLEADRVAGVFRVRYSYDNRPKARVIDRSPKHEGAAWLEFRPLEDASRLAGQYFTDRRTTGDIELRRASDA